MGKELNLNRWTEKYGLLTPLVLHTILYEKEKAQLITTQSKCLQPKSYENISVEVTLKKTKKQKKESSKLFISFFSKQNW